MKNYGDKIWIFKVPVSSRLDIRVNQMSERKKMSWEISPELKGNKCIKQKFGEDMVKENQWWCVSTDVKNND